MNTKIKLLGLGIVAVATLFAGANIVSAQTITTCNSATLNGTITDTSGVVTSAWFEWGTSFSMVESGGGNRVPSQAFSSPQNFSQVIYGLNPNTTYYWRAMVSNIYGEASGGTLSFNTPSCPIQNYNNNNNYSQPYVSTNSASSIAQNSATLNGYVTANGISATTWFEWGTSYSFGNTTPSNNYGTGSTSFNYSIYNLNQNTTYYYRAVAQSLYGTVYGSTLSFTTTGQSYNNYNYNNYTQPYVTTNSVGSVTTNSATFNGYVTSNGGNTSAWFEWGTTYSFGNTTNSTYYGTGSTSFNSSVYNLSPNTTYYYRAVAQSSYGTVYGSTISFTTSGQTYYNYSYNTNVGSAPSVNTLLATELTGTTARLNGLVFASNGLTSNAWYEWGTTASLGSRTSTVNVGGLSIVKHSDYITGLVQGQTYYYRLAAQNSYGTSYGAVNSFVSTASTYVVTPTPIAVATLKPVTTVVINGGTTQTVATLSIEGGAEMIGSGEKRTYHVKWENISAKPLTNVVVRIVFPTTIIVDSATKGAFSSADNSVVIDLKELSSKESGETFIFATSAKTLKSGELLVVTANMVYTDTKGTQGDVVAYVTHTAEATQSAVGASVFNAGEFVPTTLLGWISLMLLTLVLVLLGNHLYGRFSAAPKH